MVTPRNMALLTELFAYRLPCGRRKGGGETRTVGVSKRLRRLSPLLGGEGKDEGEPSSDSPRAGSGLGRRWHGGDELADVLRYTAPDRRSRDLG